MPRTSSRFSSTSTTDSPPGGGFSIEVLDRRPGILIARANGKGAAEAFSREGGGMRYQRVPPTEKRGRVHTSTVTVSVLPEPKTVSTWLNEKDLRWKACRSGGKGGQHANKTSSAVQLTHTPTGIQVRVESTRSQSHNKESARQLLAARLQATAEARQTDARNARRRAQVGRGMRGDKRRTIAVQRGSVTDHKTGNSTTWRRYSRGHIEDLW